MQELSTIDEDKDLATLGWWQRTSIKSVPIGSDESNTTNLTTLNSSPNLTWTLDDSGIYAIDGALYVINTNRNAGLATAFSAPSGSSGWQTALRMLSPGNIGATGNIDAFAGDILTAQGWGVPSSGGVGTLIIFRYFGYLSVASPGGQCTFKWGNQGAQTNTLTIKGGSWLRVVKMNT